MHRIHPKIVTDEHMHPIAVQIDYADWLQIQQILKQSKLKTSKTKKYEGSIKLTEDPLSFQKKIRNEWK